MHYSCQPESSSCHFLNLRALRECHSPEVNQAVIIYYNRKEAEALKTLDGQVLEETLMALCEAAEHDEDDGGI